MNERVKNLSQEALKLTPGERAELIEDLWDSLAADPDSIEVPQWHRDELDKRLAAHAAEPQGAVSWADAKARLSGRSGP